MDIAVIGAGIAGLSAAWRLRRAGQRVVVFERNYKPGGRMNSRRKAGLVVDHGERFLSRQSPTLRELMLDCGLQGELTSIDAPIFTVNEDGSFRETPTQAVDPDRAVFPGGLLMLPEALRLHLLGFNSMHVNRIDWSEELGKFAVSTEPPLRRAETLFDGVVVACPAPEAMRIAEPIRPLLNPAFAERASRVRYTRCFTFIAALEKVELPEPFYGLYPPQTADSTLAWIAFEDRKCRGRGVENWSSLIIHATPKASERYLEMDEERALKRVYEEARAVVPQLPEEWRWARAKRWEIARLKDPDQVVSHEEYPAAIENTLAEFVGDYRVGDGVEQAALSGRKGADALMQRVSE
jgi:predicted NAD/FAD-dependent oxidoreductase